MHRVDFLDSCQGPEFDLYPWKVASPAVMYDKRAHVHSVNDESEAEIHSAKSTTDIRNRKLGGKQGLASSLNSKEKYGEFLAMRTIHLTLH